MRPVIFFMMVSLNGFYERARWDVDPNGLDWHNTDDEFERFAAEQLDEADTLLFGRVTYEGMATFWPTEEAQREAPETARRMNDLEKVVFSRTLSSVSWQNSRLAQADLAAEIQSLRARPGKAILILASSDFSVDLASHGLIDEYRVMITPILLGQGKPLLVGLPQDVPLTLTGTRTFRNGNILLTYKPA